MPANRRAVQLQEGTCQTIVAAVQQHVPPSAYRDFTVWALSPDNPRRGDYLQMMGLTQLVTMNVTLFGGLVDPDAWHAVQHHMELMNSYQFFETITDNVAMGLGSPALAGAGADRLEVITALNRAMIQALTPGRSQPAVLLLSGSPRDAARRASAFDLSLAMAKHASIAEEYARYRARLGACPYLPEEVEYGLWGALVVNVELCREVAQAISDNPIGPLVRDGLISRYRSVDRCLRGLSLSRIELATLGAQSIMVLPTLAYGIGVLWRAASSPPELRAILADGALADVLFDAALLVRLQNDVGTRLLRMSGVQQASLVHRLTRRAVERRMVEAADALTLLVEEARTEISLTRLHKDIVNDEFNVALWHARRAGDADGALRAFGDSIGYFSGLYAMHSGRLATGLAALDERVGDRRTTTVIERFVRFHERMYSYPYTERIGEYAI
jgi:hypothetical protein